MEARQVVSPFLLSATGGDLFELEPVNPYSDSDLDWTDENSRVVKEHDNPNERNVALVAATVDNWEKYDTVWIGYPIWWGIAAWPVNGFVGQMILQEKRLFPSAPPPTPAWAKAENCLNKQREQAPGLRAKDFLPAHPKQRSGNGWKPLGFNRLS